MNSLFERKMIMKEIPLTQGRVTIVDDEDYPIVSLFKWWAFKIKNYHYAATTIFISDKQTTLLMHRLIMNAPFDKLVDHINHNGLDNRKTNMRLCTYSQNHMNGKPHKNSSSKYKGVHWSKHHKRWIAQIRKDNKQTRMGYFHEEKAAAQAYNFVAYELFGDFAYLNDVGTL